MRSERPLIAAVLFLATGLSLILTYCNGASSLSATYPIAASVLHLDITTTGPAALGGIVLTAIGIVLLAWAFLGAIVGQISLIFHRTREDDRILTSERIFE
ncbi:MAG TPA: hypothetical protein VL498_02765 [Terracidiphilus sp.]|jgi:hypothetical protein|nr:hypothetical protein [Terracidiphilus sp.]